VVGLVVGLSGCFFAKASFAKKTATLKASSSMRLKTIEILE
jgi:hypothetical protein